MMRDICRLLPWIALRRRHPRGCGAVKTPATPGKKWPKACYIRALTSTTYSFRILGSVEVRAGSEALDLGGRKPAALLALLILRGKDGASADRLIDELWGEEPPRTARKSLQVHVSRLRSVLGDGVLETRPQGYALRLERGQVDLHVFEDLLERGRDALREGNSSKAASLLREALVLWRGAPLAGLEGEPFARDAAARLDDLRLAAVELRVEADLALGRHEALVGELERLVSEYPFREGLRRQLMLALYRSGRQADALAAYRSARRTFMDELGVEPGPELRELETAVLRHDPALAAPSQPGRRPARKRRVLIAGIAAAALALAAAAGLFAAVRGPSSSSASRVPVPNSVVKIDPRTNEITQVTRVGRDPDAVAVGAGGVWVVNWQDRTVSRIDAAGEVETIGGVPRADHLAVDGDNVWVSSFDRSSVARIDAHTGEVVESLGVPSRRAEGLAIGGGYLWITNPATVRDQGLETVSRVDLRSHKVLSRIPVGDTPIFDTFGDGALWVANYDNSTISVVSPGSRDAETIALDGGCGPLGIATGFGSVWVVCYWPKQLVRIDSSTRRIVARIPVGSGPLSVSTGAGAVWVTNRASRTVNRIDPRSDRTVATIRLPAPLSPYGLAARGDGVWVSVRRCPQSCI
jgi:DNA-binding SARP family transcriptional activator/DNA-binding beta-propeller fold protein YncE